MWKCAGQGRDALRGAEARECKTGLFLVKEPVQKWSMEADPPLMLSADYRAMSDQFPRFLDRKAGHTHWKTLHNMPRALSSVYQNLPCPLLSPSPLLCLHSIKVLQFPGRKSFYLIFVILKLNFTFFLMHRHYPICSPIHKIDHDLEKNLSFWNDAAGRERGPTGQYSGTQTGYAQVG